MVSKKPLLNTRENHFNKQVKQVRWLLFVVLDYYFV